MMRCAIYSRKSTEEGLAQEFNSLDAQREAAEAYILSQRQAGWIVLPERYDDGGYTGANLERPALCRLLADIEAGRVDSVVVYKVDRLSRSLLDFARLMGTFEKRAVNFVSVTQQFNTTTSLGRLTLNVLSSFAQFERELIAERTRDKMAAARRKGKWVGGIPVLGYDVASGGGKLVVNEEEARQVRAIFDLYLEQQALLPVLCDLQDRQWKTKRWTTQSGTLHPGRPYSQHALLRLLTNVVYVGKVDYGGQIYAGEHPAIVEERVWQRVQSMFQQERAAEQRGLSIPQLDGRRSGPQPHANEGETELPIAVAENPQSGMPRITRLLALAIKFEGLLQRSVVKDYTDLARLGQVSRARVTQIMNLLNLAPDIQEEILSWAGGTHGKQHIRETTVRTLSAEVIWTRQREQWKNWTLRHNESAND
jgi:DNA invertase Pin-like site-specific DNA recombinase